MHTTIIKTYTGLCTTEQFEILLTIINYFYTTERKPRKRGPAFSEPFKKSKRDSQVFKPHRKPPLPPAGQEEIQDEDLIKIQYVYKV